MTCIVGIVSKDDIIMGCDSAGVSGLNIQIRKDKKVFTRIIDYNLCGIPKQSGTPKGTIEMMIGFTTSFRMGQILMYCDIPAYDEQISPFEYMVKIFVPNLIKVFGDQGFLKSYDKDEKDQKKGGTFLVAFKGHLFTIEEDFQVGEVMANYHSVGCGAHYALGSLYSTHERMPDAERLYLALETAEYFSAGVVKPFTFMEISK